MPDKNIEEYNVPNNTQLTRAVFALTRAISLLASIHKENIEVELLKDRIITPEQKEEKLSPTDLYQLLSDTHDNLTKVHELLGYKVL